MNSIVKTESSIQELKRDESREISSKLNYLIIFSSIFGIILVISNFGQLELVLWNRVIYSTGSLWQNAQPIHLNEELSILRDSIQISLIGLGIGCIIVLISVITQVYQHIANKGKSKHEISFFLVNLLIVSAIAFLGFWITKSIDVIRTLESEQDGGLTGEEWINQELSGLSNIVQLMGNIIWIFFLVLCLIEVFFVIKLRYTSYQEKKKESLERISSQIAVEHASPTFWDKAKNIGVGIIGNLPFYAILLVYLFFTFFPIYLTLKVSISNPFEIEQGINPRTGIYSMILNYSSVIFAQSVQEGSFISAFTYSIFIGLGTGIIGLAVSLTAAYALARFKFGGNRFLTFLILTTQMFPGIILLIPQYLIWSNLGMLSTEQVIGNFDVVHFGLLLASAGGATAYCTWMMKGYFETIPKDIEEAALIDGSSRFSTFIKIAIPLAKSGIVAVLVFTFLTAWQEFVLARTFIQAEAKATLPLLFYNYQDLNQPNAPAFYELLAPYAILVAFPIVLFFMLLQKELAAGAVAGGVK